MCVEDRKKSDGAATQAAFPSPRFLSTFWSFASVKQDGNAKKNKLIYKKFSRLLEESKYLLIKLQHSKH